MCSIGAGYATAIQLDMGNGPRWMIHSCKRCDPNKKNVLTKRQIKENKNNGFKD